MNEPAKIFCFVLSEDGKDYMLPFFGCSIRRGALEEFADVKNLPNNFIIKEVELKRFEKECKRVNYPMYARAYSPRLVGD